MNGRRLVLAAILNLPWWSLSFGRVLYMPVCYKIHDDKMQLVDGQICPKKLATQQHILIHETSQILRSSCLKVSEDSFGIFLFQGHNLPLGQFALLCPAPEKRRGSGRLIPNDLICIGNELSLSSLFLPSLQRRPGWSKWMYRAGPRKGEKNGMQARSAAAPQNWHLGEKSRYSLSPLRDLIDVLSPLSTFYRMKKGWQMKWNFN